MPSMSRLPVWRSTLIDPRALRPAWSATWAFLKRGQGRLPRLSARNGWLLYTLASFLLFLFLTFPSELLFRRLVTALTRESGVRIHYTESDLTWWGGCEFGGLTIERPVPGVSLLRVSRLTLSPSLIGLLQGQPFPLAFHADLYGGTFTGAVRPGESGFAVQFAAQRLSLERLPLPAPWDQGRVAGRVTADGELQGNFTVLQSLQGTLRATLTDGTLRAGAIARMPLPALQTVQARLRVTVAKGRVEVSELILDADGVEVTLQGAIALRTPLERSGLDVRLTTKITGAPPPTLKTLLSLLPASPHSPDERRASITGSFISPIMK